MYLFLWYKITPKDIRVKVLKFKLLHYCSRLFCLRFSGDADNAVVSRGFRVMVKICLYCHGLVVSGA
jgi:hypothetical protein